MSESNNNFDDIRKASIFSIISETSQFDYATLDKNENTSIAFVLNSLSSRQNSRIELISSRVEISRETIDWEDLQVKYGEKKYQNHFKEQITKYAKNYYKSCTFFRWIISMFPIIAWIKYYSFRNSFLFDVISGLTLAVIHLPQAMANGILSGLGPMNGLYVSFFPVIIYALMGTSHHTSIGTFSIMSVMTRDVVLRVQDHQSGNNTVDYEEYSSLEILTSLCLLCGLLQFLMGCLHLGALSVLLSDSLVSAFTSAAAIQIMTSYFPMLFNIELPPMKYMPFRLFREWIEFFKSLSDTNFLTFGISIIALLTLIIVQEFLEPKLKHKFRLSIPFPTDLLIVIIFTLISWLSKFSDKHNVAIIGDIPMGIPTPEFPRLEIFPLILTDAIVISVVAYAVSVSLAKTFAKKHKYKIDANQELLALGTANIFSSFFNCYPSSPSLERSSVLDRVGVISQFANLISSLILLIVILFLEPLLYHLPDCILSSIIMVALKSMFLQIKDVRRVFRLSKMEGISWIVTFGSIIIFDVDIGLLIGIAFSLISIILRLWTPQNIIMGRLPNSELYVNINHFKDALEIEGIKIYRFSCALFFINSNSFKENLYKKVLNISSNDIYIYLRDGIRGKSHINTIIIDCSSIFYVDSAGVEVIIEIIKELKLININVVLASCQESLILMLKKANHLFDKYSIYASVHDAVVKSCALNDMTSV